MNSVKNQETVNPLRTKMNRLAKLFHRISTLYSWVNIAIDDWVRSWVLEKLVEAPKSESLDKRYNIKINHVALIFLYAIIDVLSIYSNKNGILLLAFPIILWMQIRIHSVITAELMYCVQFAKGDFFRTSPKRSLFVTILWNAIPSSVFFAYPLYTIFFPDNY